MESYRLNSKLIDNNKVYLIKTVNDVSLGTVQSDIVINGSVAEQIIMPHPEQLKPEEILSLVQSTHEERKNEIEELLNSVKLVKESGDPETIFNLGLAFFFKRFIEEALDLFRCSIGFKSDFHQAYSYISQAELLMNKIPESIKAGQTAVSLRPEFADYRNILGEAFLTARQFNEAVSEFERAIDINLYYGDAYYNYGLTLLSNAIEKFNTELFQDFITRSKEYFAKASLINSDYKTAVYEKGLAALEAQDLKIAFELMKKVRGEKKEKDRKKASQYYMKYALHPQWVTEKAILDRIKYLQNEIKNNPTYVDLYAELGRCFLIYGHFVWRKGVENYRKTIEFNPSLGKLYENMEDAEKIYSDIDQLIRKIDKQN